MGYKQSNKFIEYDIAFVRLPEEASDYVGVDQLDQISGNNDNISLYKCEMPAEKLAKMKVGKFVKFSLKIECCYRKSFDVVRCGASFILLIWTGFAGIKTSLVMSLGPDCWKIFWLKTSDFL